MSLLSGDCSVLERLMRIFAAEVVSVVDIRDKLLRHLSGASSSTAPSPPIS